MLIIVLQTFGSCASEASLRWDDAETEAADAAGVANGNAVADSQCSRWWRRRIMPALVFLLSSGALLTDRWHRSQYRRVRIFADLTFNTPDSQLLGIVTLNMEFHLQLVIISVIQLAFKTRLLTRCIEY